MISWPLSAFGLSDLVWMSGCWLLVIVDHMRLDAARMNKPSAAGSLEWPIQQKSEVCKVFRILEAEKLLLNRDYFPIVLSGENWRQASFA